MEWRLDYYVDITALCRLLISTQNVLTFTVRLRQNSVFINKSNKKA
jgi:hypothetical protein